MITEPTDGRGLGTIAAIAVCIAASWATSARGAAPAEGGAPASRPRVDFRKEVRPLLSDRCFACHGPDESKRRADLRLDTREGAFEDLGGASAVVPGSPERSELYRRIAAEDPRDRMPPGKSGKALSASEVELLRRWIEEGAEWRDHWAYAPPVRPSVPEVPPSPFVRNPIDRFVLARLREAGLEPSPEADRATLARRLSLDLIGLPPSPEEVDAFVADPSEDALERLADRLLASPHFGERMAIHWLDLVRYADTTGYHGDNHRDIWPYRDWVIRAFNEDLPFDRFTTEQLAGDLLPGSTVEQKVASGYNRLNMTTQEGGAQAKEYVAKYAADRVRNAASVWLGATLQCAECHDHKYDPYTMRDFYGLAAFFADVQEMPIGEPGPGFPVPTPDQAARLRELDERIAALGADLERPSPERTAAREAWEAEALASIRGQARLGEWRSVGPFEAAGFDEAFEAEFGPELESSPATTYVGGLGWTARPEWGDGAVHALGGGISATYLARSISLEARGTVALAFGSDDGIRVWIDGKEALSRKVLRGAAADQEKLELSLEPGEHSLLVKIVNGGGGAAFWFRGRDGAIPPPVAAALRTAAAQRSPEEAKLLEDHYRAASPELAAIRERIAAARKERDEAFRQVATTMISVSIEPRVTRILPRGNWMDDSGEILQPAVPAALGRISKEGRASRLDLARWLVSPENPLTARVHANRLWKLFFGHGLARNLDDLGSQGAPPTHPELLDWLAVELVEGGWSTKRMVRLLVASGAYRQSSRPSPEALARDPLDLLLSRQSRWRLDGELVRDAALEVSGLLSRKVGGRSVKPPQPDGYWAHLNFPRRSWEQDSGEEIHRRGLYTYWQRTFLYPSFLAFDVPTREECAAERNRSNTPLQSLVLLNDPVYVEAARALAGRILVEGGRTTEARIEWAWRRATSRSPEPREVEVLARLLEKHLAEYRSDPEAASRILGAGPHPAPAGIDRIELAAWTSVGRAILNLHETITRS